LWEIDGLLCYGRWEGADCLPGSMVQFEVM
jgi:hypothetical protein